MSNETNTPSICVFPEVVVSDKIEAMINNLKEAVEKIDRDMIEDWVDDLVLQKTFVGLKTNKALRNIPVCIIWHT